MTEPPGWLVARLRAAGCVFAQEEAALLWEAVPDPVNDERFEHLVARRVAGEPLEHVLGWVAFAGRRWTVGPGVFVPRVRSELLVAEAVRAAGPGDDGPSDDGPSDDAPGPAAAHRPLTVVDLCCGSGALGGAVAARLRDTGRDVVLHACDLDPAATACAAQNLAWLGGVVHTGDLYTPLPATLRGRVDLLLCHAPYVPTAAIPLLPPEARQHEPRHALDGGPDGLDLLRRVIARAADWLAPPGALLFELGDAVQQTAATRLVTASGMQSRIAQDDEAGATVVVATRCQASG